MGSNEKADGLARADRLEKDNQVSAGARSGHAAKKLGPLAAAKHNPKKGKGGINRALSPAG